MVKALTQKAKLTLKALDLAFLPEYRHTSGLRDACYGGGRFGVERENVHTVGEDLARLLSRRLLDQ